jgi:hypothetical protein
MYQHETNQAINDEQQTTQVTDSYMNFFYALPVLNPKPSTPPLQPETPDPKP